MHHHRKNLASRRTRLTAGPCERKWYGDPSESPNQVFDDPKALTITTDRQPKFVLLAVLMGDASTGSTGQSRFGPALGRQPQRRFLLEILELGKDRLRTMGRLTPCIAVHVSIAPIACCRSRKSNVIYPQSPYHLVHYQRYHHSRHTLVLRGKTAVNQKNVRIKLTAEEETIKTDATSHS